MTTTSTLMNQYGSAKVQVERAADRVGANPTDSKNAIESAINALRVVSYSLGLSAHAEFAEDILRELDTLRVNIARAENGAPVNRENLSAQLKAVAEAIQTAA